MLFVFLFFLSRDAKSHSVRYYTIINPQIQDYERRFSPRNNFFTVKYRKNATSTGLRNLYFSVFFIDKKYRNPLFGLLAVSYDRRSLYQPLLYKLIVGKIIVFLLGFYEFCIDFQSAFFRELIDKLRRAFQRTTAADL